MLVRVWPGLCLATMLTRTRKKRVGEVTRTLSEGTRETAHHLARVTAGCQQFHTSWRERFNATMRERLASLTRTGRPAAQRLETLETGMSLIGSPFHFCWPHQE
jgi:hypothetical protein